MGRLVSCASQIKENTSGHSIHRYPFKAIGLFGDINKRVLVAANVRPTSTFFVEKFTVAEHDIFKSISHIEA